MSTMDKPSTDDVEIVDERLQGRGQGDAISTKQNYLCSKMKGNNLFISALHHFDINVFKAMTGTKIDEFNGNFCLVE